MSGRAVTLGSCYVDVNVAQFPFDGSGIPAERELVGGDYEILAGGSAPNFCRQVAKIGSLMPTFVGVIGNDELGATLQTLFHKDNTDARLITLEGSRTGISFNMTGVQGHHIMVVGGTSNAHMDASILPKLDEALLDAQYFYLGGVFKLKSLMASLPQIVEMANRQNNYIVVDHARIPQGTTPEELEAVRKLVLASDYYFPSFDEFKQLWGDATVEELLDKISAQAPKLTTFVKNGAADVHYKGPDGRGTVPAVKLEGVGDVTGAGDTFNAAVLSALSDKKTLSEAAAFGCQIAAQKIAAKPVTPQGGLHA